MQSILVSACLLGEECRYDGTGALLEDIEALRAKYNLISVCPEVADGLPIPRPAAEVLSGRVIGSEGTDFTEAFHRGAQIALELAKANDCTIAIMKERSPSCGFERIYDGTHTSRMIDGNGVTTQLLLDNGIKVIGDSDISELL